MLVPTLLQTLKYRLLQSSVSVNQPACNFELVTLMLHLNKMPGQAVHVILQVMMVFPTSLRDVHVTTRIAVVIIPYALSGSALR